MELTVYVSFKGDCEAAFTFYERSLDGKRGPMFRYEGSPLAGQVSEDWKQKIMHGSITIGGQTLMGADIASEQYQPPQGFSLSLQMKSTAVAERVFRELSEGGRVLQPLQQTFWAARFGVLVDRFGLTWLINCEEQGG